MAGCCSRSVAVLLRAVDPGLDDPRSGALSVSVASESVGGVELGVLGSFYCYD